MVCGGEGGRAEQRGAAEEAVTGVQLGRLYLAPLSWLHLYTDGPLCPGCPRPSPPSLHPACPSFILTTSSKHSPSPSFPLPFPVTPFLHFLSLPFATQTHLIPITTLTFISYYILEILASSRFPYPHFTPRFLPAVPVILRHRNTHIPRSLSHALTRY